MWNAEVKGKGNENKDFVRKIKWMKLLGCGYLSQIGGRETAGLHSFYIKCQIWEDAEKTAVGRGH